MYLFEDTTVLTSICRLINSSSKNERRGRLMSASPHLYPTHRESDSFGFYFFFLGLSAASAFLEGAVTCVSGLQTLHGS